MWVFSGYFFSVCSPIQLILWNRFCSSPQNEEQKRTVEQETSLTKYREQVLVQHSMEIEKLHDRHRKEIQKYQVQNIDLWSMILIVQSYQSIIFFGSGWDASA